MDTGYCIIVQGIMYGIIEPIGVPRVLFKEFLIFEKVLKPYSIIFSATKNNKIKQLKINKKRAYFEMYLKGKKCLSKNNCDTSSIKAGGTNIEN